ncbi:MAG TPA: thermonuclease family protein [Patescibacteria group bacterium]|nr:thermonuclease family protein [Patescibacteria group bacterium]
MLQHISHHKHGIKQTVFAFMFLTIVGAVLFIGTGNNFVSQAAEPAPQASFQVGTAYDLPSFKAKSDSTTNSDAKVNKDKKYTLSRPKNLPTYLIKNVVDGNIVMLENNQRVRLAGIKAPEKDEEWGMEAADYLKNIVEGKQIYLQLDNKNPEDSFGRLRAIIYLDNKNINTEILRAGLAHIYISTPSMISTGDWTIYEKEAQESRKGLWSNKKIENNNSISITERLKEYLFPSMAKKAPASSASSSYDAFLKSMPTDGNTNTENKENSTTAEKTLPTL